MVMLVRFLDCFRETLFESCNDFHTYLTIKHQYNDQRGNRSECEVLKISSMVKVEILLYKYHCICVMKRP